jgi:hypothetical protein
MLDDLAPRFDVEVVPEEQACRSDGHQIPVAQAPFADPVPVDEGAVGRVAVAEEVLAPPELDHRMAAGHHGIREHDVVAGVASDRKQGLGQGDLSPGR